MMICSCRARSRLQRFADQMVAFRAADAGVHCSSSDMLGCNHQRGFGRRFARRQIGKKQQGGNDGQPVQVLAPAPENQKRDHRGHQREDERNAVDAHERRHAQRQRHVDSRVAERQPRESERSMRALDAGPQRGDGRNRVAGLEQHRRQHAKQRPGAAPSATQNSANVAQLPQRPMPPWTSSTNWIQ